MISSTTNGSSSATTPPPTSLTTITKVFEGRRLTTIRYTDKPWWIAREIGATLQYGGDGKGLVELISREWADEFDDADRWLVQGEDLKAIKQILGDELAREVGVYYTPTLLLLSESGIWKAALLSRKPEGRRLRTWLSGEVLPEIRATGRFQGDLAQGQLPILIERVANLEAQIVSLRNRPTVGRYQPDELRALIADEVQKALALRTQRPAQPQIAAPPPPDPATLLLQHVEAGDLAEPFTVRDVYVKRWRGLHKAGAERAVVELVQRGCLQSQSRRGSHGGRPTITYLRPGQADLGDETPIVIDGRILRTPSLERNVRQEILDLLRREHFRGGLVKHAISDTIRRRVVDVKNELRALVAEGILDSKPTTRGGTLYFIPMN